jgi:hypothetical protein
MGPLIGIAARVAGGVAARAAAKQGYGKIGQAAAGMAGRAAGGRVAGMLMGQQDGAPKQFRGADLTEYRGY